MIQKISLIHLTLLLILGTVPAQRPQFSIKAGVGLWQDALKYDAYSNDYGKTQPYAVLGAGAKIALHPKISFVPELGLEYYRMNYLYSYSHSSSFLFTQLGIFYAKLAVGLEFRPFGGWRAGIALSYSGPLGAKGIYEVVTYQNGLPPPDTVMYTSGFRRILNIGNIGPEFKIGHDFVFANGGSLGPSLVGYYGPQPVFMPNLATPKNPIVRRLSLVLVYTFPSKNHEND